MKFMLTFIAQLILLQGYAQKDSLPAPFLQFPFIPQFTIMKAGDSSAFTREDLLRKREVLIIIFSPECDHCLQQVKDIIANIDKFKNFQIVMTTWLPHQQMDKFYNDNGIAKFPNIIMGRDTKFFFPVHYSLKILPGIYVYDKKHRLKKYFEKNATVEELLQ